MSHFTKFPVILSCVSSPYVPWTGAKLQAFEEHYINPYPANVENMVSL